MIAIGSPAQSFSVQLVLSLLLVCAVVGFLQFVHIWGGESRQTRIQRRSKTSEIERRQRLTLLLGSP